MPDLKKIIYHTRIKKSDPVFIWYKVVWEIPKAGIEEGAGGWVGVSPTTLPDLEDTISTYLTNTTWSSVLEPVLISFELNPRYKAGYALFTGIFRAPRVWESVI